MPPLNEIIISAPTALEVLTKCSASLQNYLTCEGINPYEYGIAMGLASIAGVIGVWYNYRKKKDEDVAKSQKYTKGFWFGEVAFGLVGGAFIGFFVTEVLLSTMQNTGALWIITFLCGVIAMAFFSRMIESGISTVDGLFDMLDRVILALFQSVDKVQVHEVILPPDAPIIKPSKPAIIDLDTVQLPLVEQVVTTIAPSNTNNQWYSQRSPLYGDLLMSPSLLTVRKAGCLFTSICNFYGKDPAVILPKAISMNAWQSNGELFGDIVAKACGGVMLERFETYKGGKCVGRMKGSGGFDNHFVLILEDGVMIDPWQATPEPSKVDMSKVFSFRYFR